MSFIRQRSFTRISLRRKTSKDDGDDGGKENGDVKLVGGGEVYGEFVARCKATLN